MKKNISVSFTNFWKGFDKNDNYYLSILREIYDVTVVTEFSTDIDLLIYSCFHGFDESNSDDYIGKVKTLYVTPENDFPSFNKCDYAISMNDFSFDDRHLRIPLWVMYHYENITGRSKYKHEFINCPNLDNSYFYNRKHIALMVSNLSTCDVRKLDYLNGIYNNIGLDAGGRGFNNIGYNVDDKIGFTSGYKFECAFENSLVNGYVTEKIYEAFVANTIPIYWGSDYAKRDFNPKAFINVEDYFDYTYLIEDIVKIGNDKNRYMEILNTPRNFNYDAYMSQLKSYFVHIIENGKIYNHSNGILRDLSFFK